MRCKMANQDDSPEKAAKLRRQAEKIARERQSLSQIETGDLSPEEIRKAFHELQVHQIELEMQNDEMRRTQADLDAERERYFNLFELAPVGYCTISAGGLIDKINLTAASLLGISRSALITRPLILFIAKEDRDIYYKHQKQLEETAEPQAYELRMLKEDGTLWWARLEAAAEQDEGGSSACRLTLSDITKRKKVADKLNASYAKEHKLRQHLEDEAKNRIRFIDELAHELKGPLTPILNSSGMLREILPPEASSMPQKLADNIFTGTQLLNNRLEELLDVARFARGVVTLNKQSTDLRQFIEQVVSRYTPSITRRKQQLLVDIAEDIPAVYLDQSRLEQVLVNLLSNASKYSPDSSRIQLTASQQANELLISVKDEGIGISPEDQAVLFQPYQRVGRDQQKVQGLGLGLTVVKHIIEAHEGQVWVNSEQGKGSTFSFTIPVSCKEVPGLKTREWTAWTTEKRQI